MIDFPSTIDVWLCVSTPTHPYLLASVYSMYGLVVSGYFSMGAEQSVSVQHLKRVITLVSPFEFTVMG